MTTKIRVAETVEDLEKVQTIFNAKGCIEYLGGFTMLQTLKDKVKPGKSASVWLAEVDGEPVGACEVAGRPQSHLMKYGEIATLPGHRRKRIATGLYYAMTLQGILEGRRLYEDTIVSDNPMQHQVLPTWGCQKAGELHHRTASGLNLCLYQFDLLQTPLDRLEGRVDKAMQVEVIRNHYTRDLYAKNMEIFRKHEALAYLENEFKAFVWAMEEHPTVQMTEGAPLAHNAGKARKAEP